MRRLGTYPSRTIFGPAAQLLILLSAAGAFAASTPEAFQKNTPTAAKADDAEAAVLAEREALGKEIAEARQVVESTEGEAHDHAEREAALLEKIDLLYSQQLTALRQAAELQDQKKEVDAELEKLRRDGPGTPPYSLTDLDEARAELKAESKRSKGLSANVQAARDAVDAAREAEEESARRRREAKEALRTNTDPAESGALERKVRLRALGARVDAEEEDLLSLQLANEKATREIHDLRQTLLTERVAQLERGVEFDQKALQAQLDKLEKEEAALRDDLKAAKRALSTAERNWARAKRQLDAVSEPGQEITEEAEARRLELNTDQLRVSLLEQRQHRLGILRDVWKHRHALANGKAQRETLEEWAAEASRAVEQLRRDERVYRARLREIADAQRTPGSEAAQDLSESAGRWRRAQKKQLETRRKLYERALESVAGDLRVQEAFAKDLDSRLEQVPLRERLRGFLRTAGAVWNYEIFSVDDQPITVAKIVVGLVFFLAGLLFASYVSRQLGDRVFPRLRLEAGSAAALQSAVYYFLVVMVLVFVLRLVNVPLTAFTLLGGAFAIGIGFGSQNVVNNFISGIILLIEQPVRPGDLTEVDGTYGTVERIGLRSTRIRSSTNVDIIVPNSSFLEKNVINWTLSDDRIRTHVSVGVVYGSPTGKVTELIRKVVEEHDRILEIPAPVILFTEFGDNALTFEVHFWMRMRTLMDRRVVESDLRYRINDLFNEAGIVIAFPQRDVHLDSVRPVEVKIIAPESPPSRDDKRRHERNSQNDDAKERD